MKKIACIAAVFCLIAGTASAGERQVKSTRGTDNNKSMACDKAKANVERHNNSYTRVVKMNGCECAGDGKEEPILYSCSIDFVVEKRN